MARDNLEQLDERGSDGKWLGGRVIDRRAGYFLRLDRVLGVSACERGTVSMAIRSHLLD